jgi:putative peptidoglycan lipid II flippase
VDSDAATQSQARSKRTNRSALTLMVGTLASRVTGFLRQSLLTQLFSSTLTDAFIVAQRVPNLFRELLAEGALTNSFVPVYKRLSRVEAKKLSSALLGLLIAVNALLLVVIYFATPWLVNLLLVGKGNVDRELATQLTRIVFPFLGAISLSAWAMGILNAEEKFLAPAWAPVALNLVSVPLMLLFPNNAVWLAVGLVIGGIAQFVVQLPTLLKGKFVASLNRLWHPGLADVLLLMIPSVLTTSGRQLLNVVTTNVLNQLPKGSVTANLNADLFLSLALGLFSVSPALAYYSRLSDNAAHEPETFNKTLLSGLRFITFLTLPAGLFLTVLARPITESVFNWMPLFGRAGADESILNFSVYALVPLGLAVFPLGLNALLIRIFYIRKRIRTSMIVTLVFLTLQGVLYYFLARRLGIAGLSWATVMASWLQLLTLLLLVWRLERFNINILASQVWRIAIAAGLASLAVYALGFLPWTLSWWSAIGHTVLGMSIFALTYGLFSFLLGIDEIKQLVNRLRS